MKIDWQKYLGQTLNITMHENYGLTLDKKTDTTIYEIVFKTGKLEQAFDDGLLLDAVREKEHIKIFVPFSSVKCVEIFNI